MSFLEVVSWGVLGSQLTVCGSVEQISCLPTHEMVITDPAGLNYLRNTPKGAGGAAGSIYKWLELDQNELFPESVRAIDTLGAVYHEYSQDKHVIHVIGPDFRFTPNSQEQALAKLTTCYENILEQFILSEKQSLRLLPVSGGIFSGPFVSQLHILTYQAISDAFSHLDPGKQFLLSTRNVQLCIFSESEFQRYQTQFSSKLGCVE